MMIVGKASLIEGIEATEVMHSIGQEVHDTKPLTHNIDMARPRDSNDGWIPPVWWFQHFDPCWAPLRKWFSWKRSLTLQEFRLVTAHVSGLTSIEKTIAVAAFVASKNIQ